MKKIMPCDRSLISLPVAYLVAATAICSAHQAFLTREALAEIARVTVANLVAFATGQPFLRGTTLNAQPQSQ
ncbi:MAG: hypothetical protein DMF01_09200 [Verrucomicrobia bacterium]|nr:MAG: hypothetical protein DMF01_09200 [Verrucomicrobiota bacterium]